MFTDLMDEEIQPEEINVGNVPEIELSETLQTQLMIMLKEEENSYTKVSLKTTVVKTDKNYVFFSNQWFYLAVICKKYAMSLYPYCEFFENKIKTNSVVLKCFMDKNYTPTILNQLFNEKSDLERMIKFIDGGADFRPGKNLLNDTKTRSCKDIFGSCILGKLAVPNASSAYLGNIVYYLAKRPELFDKLENEIKSQIGQAGSPNNNFSLTGIPSEFTTDFSRRYITSLLAKPFVILTGNSGTGKTRIAKQFAEYLEVNLESGERNWVLIPVGADWTDNTKILGFYNPLANDNMGEYVKTSIVKLIENANKNKSIPFFLILDEMNLSHVERYFSDFLSHMETPEISFVLDGYEGDLKFPSNLFVVGTVNVDETTYMFSPKVLDRANVVEFKPEKKMVMDMFLNPANLNMIHAARDGSAEAFLILSNEIRRGKCKIDEQMEDVMEFFDRVYDITEKYEFEFAYRTVKEIRQYISAAYEISENPEEFTVINALDEQLLQKILPKIHGNKKEIGELLNDLEKICNEKKMILSEMKIKQMKGKLAKIQYASFI